MKSLILITTCALVVFTISCYKPEKITANNPILSNTTTLPSAIPSVAPDSLVTLIFKNMSNYPIIRIKVHTLYHNCKGEELSIAKSSYHTTWTNETDTIFFKAFAGASAAIEADFKIGNDTVPQVLLKKDPSPYITRVKGTILYELWYKNDGSKMRLNGRFIE